jgi:RNA polymerase sigma factor (sigma-70 family)
MFQTPASLLERLRSPFEPQAWEHFVSLYTPLIWSWARRVGLQEPDAADLVQDVFVTLLQVMPTFTYDRNQSFRRWLQTVTLNKWRKARKRPANRLAGEQLERPEDVPGNGVTLKVSVGGACRKIIDAHVELRTYATGSRDGSGPPHEASFLEECGGIKKWWKTRKNKTLAQLQLEEIEWMLRRKKPASYTTKEWAEKMRDCERLARHLRSEKKPIGVKFYPGVRYDK